MTTTTCWMAIGAGPGLPQSESGPAVALASSGWKAARLNAVERIRAAAAKNDRFIPVPPGTLCCSAATPVNYGILAHKLTGIQRPSWRRGGAGHGSLAPMNSVPPDQVEMHFTAAVRDLAPGGARRPSGMIRESSALSALRCLELFDAQLASRHIDTAARWLQAEGAGFYPIGSSGHEGNAGLAAALRLTDPALLHYRSGAFYLARAGQASPPRDGVSDVLLGLVAAAAEPISGGRHKVFGHRQLNVIPQTSTIASHLPRALGLAFALARAAKLGIPARWPQDAIVVCSFGDASANHSTATGAINTAAYCSYQGLPLPLLLVCEDNGLGISVRTPPGWIEAAQSGRPCG